MNAPLSPENFEVFEATLTWAGAQSLRQLLKVWSSDEIDSTNSFAKNDENPATVPNTTATPTLYLTRRQTAGRGRGDHVWTTPAGSNLLSSWSFLVRSIPQPIFSALAGLALFQSARNTWPTARFNLKAPNDLFIHDKKVAGILIETIDRGQSKRTVIGLGLNVNSHPTELRTSTCLREHVEVNAHDWEKFLGNWHQNLKLALEDGLRPHLKPESAENLRHALNLHPLLKEPILRVDELCQLHSASRVVHWHEL